MLVVFVLSISGAFSQSAKKIVILHTNDMHSRLDGFSPSLEYSPLSLNDDKTIGGFSRLATIIEREKNANMGRTIVVDAGDFLMGTIFHYMEEHNGFQLPLMKEMGYDIVAIGNHEFDYGPEKLASIINTSVGRAPIPKLMLTNVVFEEKDLSDNSLEKLFNNNTIVRKYIIEREGVKIGFFSLMGIDANDVAPLASPVTFSKQIKSAKIAVKDLKEMGVDVIICLSHSGIEKDKKGEWTGEDVSLAKKVDGIDLIISGHTHSRLEKPLIVDNTPIVQTGSEARNLGRIEIEVTEKGIELISYKLIRVDDSIQGNKGIQQKIDEQKHLINEKLLKPQGYNVDVSLLESGFEAVCDEYGGDLENSNLGPLVADAIHTYINEHAKTGTDISMVATGVIRDRIPVGKVSVQDIFRIMSLGSGEDNVPGYPLATVYLSGIEIKRVIEILLVTSKSSPSNYCFYSGLEADYNPDKGLLKKIQKIYLIKPDGSKATLDLDKKSTSLYSVSANFYMLKMIGIIKKTTFGLVSVIPKDANGLPISDMASSIIDFDSELPGVQEGKEWIALVELLRSMDDTNGNGIADLDEFYKKPALRLKPNSK